MDTKFFFCQKHGHQVSKDICDKCKDQPGCKDLSSQFPAIQRDRKQSATELDGRIQRLASKIVCSYFDLGLALKAIKENSYFQELGFESFPEYVERRHGFKYRKAQELIAITENCISAKLNKEDVEHIGWTKVAELPKLTVENKSEWIDKAERLTVRELRTEVKQTGQSSASRDDSVTYITFSFKPEQREVVDRALKIATELTGSKIKSYLFQILATEFIATYGVSDSASETHFKSVHAPLTDI